MPLNTQSIKSMFELYNTLTEDVEDMRPMNQAEADNLNDLNRQVDNPCRWVPVQIESD